jgi:pectate lyase
MHPPPRTRSFNERDSAVVQSTFYPMGWFGNGVSASGTARMLGDLEVYSSKCNNIFYGLVDDNWGGVSNVEGNYFENAAKPHWDTGNGLIDADISSNRYTGISANDPDKDAGSTVFRDIKLYSYDPDSANDVPQIVDQGAGPQ